jgi:hypothetical protein
LDTASFTKEEAILALEDPEKGSLRVLKALGKQRDIFSRELTSGKKKLFPKNPFEEACAEAAIKDFKETLLSFGETPPSDLEAVKPEIPGAPPASLQTALPDHSSITREQAVAALEDPEKGSLRVLKALGRQRDIYSRELLSGQKRLVVRNPFEEVCAEAAIKDFQDALRSEGEVPPDDLKVFRSGMF